MEKFIMKKQIIAAAVAATMTSVAFADISITGSTKVNFKAKDTDATTEVSTNTVSTEHDLAIVGKMGDTSYTTKWAIDSAGSAIAVEDNYLATKVGDINLKVGDWDNGNNYLRESARNANQLEAKTTVGPVGVTFWSGHDDTNTHDKITLTTELNGINLKYVTQNDDEEYVVSGSVAGINASLHMDNNDAANTDRSSLELSTKLNDIDVKVVTVDTDTSARFGGDSWLGDWEHTTAERTAGQGLWQAENGMDLTGVSLATSMAGNKVEYRHIKADQDGSTVANSTDRTINRFIVTRPLASGATFELMYTDAEEQGDAAASYSELDLELSVKF